MAEFKLNKCITITRFDGLTIRPIFNMQNMLIGYYIHVSNVYQLPMTTCMFSESLHRANRRHAFHQFKPQTISSIYLRVIRY